MQSFNYITAIYLHLYTLQYTNGSVQLRSKCMKVDKSYKLLIWLHCVVPMYIIYVVNIILMTIYYFCLLKNKIKCKYYL